jgi:hypothetical protein
LYLFRNYPNVTSLRQILIVAGPLLLLLAACASTPSPMPQVAFPRQGPGERDVMEALLVGELAQVNGCLRVKSSEIPEEYLPIWPAGFRLGTSNPFQVLNEAGEVVAQVGQEVRLGGGEVPDEVVQEVAQMEEPLPSNCLGPYWVVGELL